MIMPAPPYFFFALSEIQGIDQYIFNKKIK